MRFFKKESEGRPKGRQRPDRHSRGWGEILVHLKTHEALRVLDFGATSPHNINYLTALGHSVYMANVVEEAARPDWHKAPDPDAKPASTPEFDVANFAAANLGFSARQFDVVLLWDTANYLPAALGPELFKRLGDVLRPGGRLLAFFHSRSTGPETACTRFQLTDSSELATLDGGGFPVLQIYQTRQIERFLDGYSDVRFFVGKDNVREVIATR